MSDSQHIGDFPTHPIEVECKKCGHHGRYRKAPFIEKYDSDVVLSDLLAPNDGDCKFRGGLSNRGCGAYYLVLSRRNQPLNFG